MTQHNHRNYRCPDCIHFSVMRLGEKTVFYCGLNAPREVSWHAYVCGGFVPGEPEEARNNGN